MAVVGKDEKRVLLKSFQGDGDLLFRVHRLRVRAFFAVRFPNHDVAAIGGDNEAVAQQGIGGAVIVGGDFLPYAFGNQLRRADVVGSELQKQFVQHFAGEVLVLDGDGSCNHG